MPLRWISPSGPTPASAPAPAASPLVPEEPKIVLVAPGSITPRHRLTTALAAGSLLAVALRPLPRPQVPRALASPITVINNNAGGPGSLFQAVQHANADAGPDTISFSPNVSGTIALTGTLVLTNSVQITGPGPGVLSVSGANINRVFYLTNTSKSPLTATITGLTIRDGSSISSTKPGGGGIEADNFDLTLDHVDLISNTAGSKANGGGLGFRPSITVSLTIRDSLLSGNYAGTGGGIYLYHAQAGVVITNTQIVSNTSYYGGGGGAYLKKPDHLLIEDSTIMSNTAGSKGFGFGGGLNVRKLYGASATIRRTTISGNTASGPAGGIYFYYSANVLIEDSTIAGNEAKTGGGIDLGHTGGVSNTIRRTTISGNTAGVEGGGVNLFDVQAPLSIENSTISGNYADTGGGIYLNDPSQVSIQNSTIFSNTAASSGGGIQVKHNSLPITDTIIAANVAPLNSDIAGTFRLSYDLVQITGTAAISDAGGNLFGLDPLLGPLADNGGPTLTHLPARNSPVVNAGDPAFAPPPFTDQRGDPRVVGGRVDIGSVELNPGSVQLSSSSLQVNENGITATVTVTRTGGSDGAVSVDYATGGGTAIAGTDYQTATGTLHWANGDAAPKTFTVQITDDHLFDPTATVGLNLSNPQGGVQLGSPITGTLTIVDNVFTLDLPLVRR